MSSKRRKLDVATEKPQLSAIAARKAYAAQQTGSPSKQSPTSSRQSQNFEQGIKQGLSNDSTQKDTSRLNDGLTPVSPATFIVESNVHKEEQENHTSSSESSEQPPEVIFKRPSVTFSTFNANEENSKVLTNKTLALKLMPGERLVILGQYDLEIKEGHVTVLGAVLKASRSRYRIYAAASHSLPVIRCPAGEINAAVLRLHQSDSGIRTLESLSPLFGKLWNEDSQLSGSGYRYQLSKKLEKSTFQILLSSEDAPSRSYLQPIISPPEWNATLSKLVNSSQITKRIILCGPKSSGKSTFAKLLVNKLLSTNQNEMHNASQKLRRPPGIALLDLDPGQPEYSHPGQLSLIHIQESNFGPPTTHPVPGVRSRLVRAHALGAASPSMDPSLYMSCALDLFAHYRNLSSLYPNCPLVINTPGWVLGTGLEILTDLIAKVHPSEVVYMSQEGPAEVVEILRDAGAATPFITLPSQSSEYMTRTAAHLRTMQSMSYFHLNPEREGELAWDGTPLTSMPPWEIKYTGEDAGILGIMCYGEQPPSEVLAETINGSLLSIVIIEDPAAIPGYTSSSLDSIDPSTSDLSSFNTSTFPDLQTPSIIRTPHSNIPYFNPANAITLNPQHSHTIGMALVRGIDIKRQRLQILSPISPDLITSIHQEGKQIVLVSGKLDTPGWAYVEELVKRDWTLKEKRRKESDNETVDADSIEEDDDPSNLKRDTGFRNAPWVERLTGSQGRGIGARVWRVRRDLGKMGDGD